MRLLAALGLLLPALVRGGSVDPPFENTAIVRNVELGGSLTISTTTYAIRALKDDVKRYVVTLSKEDGSATSLTTPMLKETSEPLVIARTGFDDESEVYYYELVLPAPLRRNENTTIVFGSTLNHAVSPWPLVAAQQDPNLLVFRTDMLIQSPYHTVVQRTKIRAPSEVVLAASEPSPVSVFARDAQATSSGATVTYGPFSNVPPSMDLNFKKEHQYRVAVNYESKIAMMTVVSQHRTAEISHWGANINIQDEVHLKNTGPELKGHFARIVHQHAGFFNQPMPHSIWWLKLQLPAGIRNPYFYDLVGNVSTSHFRPAPSVPRELSPFFNPKSLTTSNWREIESRFSSLEIRPRYPVLGGWNYSFTVGWDAPLADFAARVGPGRYSVGVPFLNTFRDVAVDEAQLRIILPEGATDVEVVTPFAVDSLSRSTTVTFLDTVGRPTVELRKAQVCDRHDQVVYVTYTVPLRAHLQKPVAVAAALVGLFVLAGFMRRLDMRIHVPPKARTKAV